MLTPIETMALLHKQTEVPVFNHIDAKMYLRSGQEMLRMVRNEVMKLILIFQNVSRKVAGDSNTFL